MRHSITVSSALVRHHCSPQELCAHPQDSLSPCQGYLHKVRIGISSGGG